MVLLCVDFMDVMYTAHTIFSILAAIGLYNLAILCLNGTLSRVDLMDAIMGRPVARGGAPGAYAPPPPPPGPSYP